MKPTRRAPARATTTATATATRIATAIAFVALTLASGCGGSNGGGGASPPVDSGHDLTSSPDTGSGAGSCPPRPDLAAAAPTCSNVMNTAAGIPFTAATGPAPAPLGGVIEDGLYESTRTEAYGATTGFGRRITFVILEGATRMLWAGQVLDMTGTAAAAPSFGADTAIRVNGTHIDFTVNCVSTTPSPIPPTLDFSVMGANLVLSLASGNTVAATTYTRRGCAPPP